MDITPLIIGEKNVIKRYGNGKLILTNDAIYDDHIILFPDKVYPWDISNAQNISGASLAPLFEHSQACELLLIGCGQVHMPVPSDLYLGLKKRSIALEMMNTGAACRTYNVLLSEGRDVAAALLLV